MDVRHVTFSAWGNVSTIPVSCQTPRRSRPRNCVQSSASSGGVTATAATNVMSASVERLRGPWTCMPVSPPGFDAGFT